MKSISTLLADGIIPFLTKEIAVSDSISIAYWHIIVAAAVLIALIAVITVLSVKSRRKRL
jgi:uncharacterized membrane protein YcaP (DUF421 family)